MATRATSVESGRLDEARAGVPWKRWGPYLSERQWGTVREDYSENGDAWNYFSHDQARSRAYRWGEDGIAGISDDQQRLCFALALWNGHDPILKERLFGLTNSEGNHGEDVKEYYFYLDSHADPLLHEVPLQVPAGGVPVRRPGRRPIGAAAGTSSSTSCSTPGVFDEDRYFDVFVEYAKASPEDMLDPDHGPQPRARAGDASCPADALVPQHLVVGGGQRPGRAARRRRRVDARPIAEASHPSSGDASSTATASRDAAVHRERDQHRAPLRRAEPHARTSRTASTTTSSTASATR